MLVVFSIVNDVSCEANENCLRKKFQSSKFCVLLISFNSSSFFLWEHPNPGSKICMDTLYVMWYENF